MQASPRKNQPSIQEPGLEVAKKPSESDADSASPLPRDRLFPFWDAASPSIGFSSIEEARFCSLGEDTWVFPAIIF